MQRIHHGQADFLLTPADADQYPAADVQRSGHYRGGKIQRKPGSGGSGIHDSADQYFTNLFIGISLGANVLAARYYAARRDKEMSEAVHTAIALALISGIVMAFVGFGLSRFAWS